MNIKHRPKSLRLSGLTDVCGKVSVYGCKGFSRFGGVCRPNYARSHMYLI